MSRRLRAALRLAAVLTLAPASAEGEGRSALALLQTLGGEEVELARNAGDIRRNVRETVTRAQLDARIVAVIRKSLPAVVSVRAGPASGSGFVIRASGLVTTNAHVVAPAGLGGAVELQWSDGSREFGTVVGFNEAQNRDLAFVQINRNAQKTRSQSWPFLEIAAPDSLGVNHPVLALGSPQGLRNTATFGHVSSLDARAGTAVRFIQIDADINPGNSGGPLIDLEGRVVGVNARIYSAGTGGSTGVGYAIPAALVLKSLEQFDATYDLRTQLADIQRGWLGAEFTFVLDFGRARDLQIESIHPGGPADRAGLRQGDRIVEVSGVPVPRTTPRANFQLQAAVLERAPGDTLVVTILRGEEQMQVEVELGAEPDLERPTT